MILTSLTLTDFGVFRGKQVIDLLPSRGRPVLLIGGKNGAGKTTLMEAIRLCFYGATGLGLRLKDDYAKYLEGKIHRNPNSVVQPSFASVEVEFRYSDIDAVRTYKVARSWERKQNGKLQELLTIHKDGKPLDEIAAEQWPDFVRDLIPPGLAQLFFFDGEKIQHLANDDSDQHELGEAIKALLGLDIVERLQTDLGIFRSRAVKNLGSSAGAKELEELEQGLQHLRQRRDDLYSSRSIHETNIADLRLGISRTQEKVAAQGGSFSQNRDKLIHSRAVLQTRVEQLEKDIRDLCDGLLPFALIPGLCDSLKTQLLKEEALSEAEVGKAYLQRARLEITQRVQEPKFWKSLPEVTKPLRSDISRSLESLFKEALGSNGDTSGAESVHNLSPTLSQQLIGWVDAAPSVRKEVADYGAELERLHRELHRVEGDLRRVPPDELLKPLLADLQRLNEQLADVGKAALLVDEKIKTVELELSTVQRKYEQGVERLAAQAQHGSQVQLIPKIQNVLDEFKSALLMKKLLQLQTVVTNSFNALCRKNGTVREITINPGDFSVVFKGTDGKPIAKSQLSAGEKQIYAISMLWGLAKTSGRPLPIVIDTPLGRLDTDHRRLLTEHYFPFASHQVVILSTDSEIDQAYFRDLRRSISHAYRLEFNMKENGTILKNGYFWNETN